MKGKYLFMGLLLTTLMVIAAIYPSEIHEELSNPQDSAKKTTMVFAEDKSLSEKMDNILEKEELDGTVLGVTVMHAADGEVLYSHNGDIRLRPASNMKLVTSIAALETLGADYRFRTEILTDGKQIGTTLHGNLYLKGKGDPTLLKTDLNLFAKEIKELGIHTIEGNVIGDDTWYDDIRLSEDLNWSDESFYTGAQISALTLSPDEDYDAGTVIVEVTPSSTAEGKAQIQISPETDYVTIVNQTKMVSAGESQQIEIEREHGTNQIIVKGTMPADGELSRSWTAVWNPTEYVLNMFQKSLNEQGIEITGGTKEKVTPTQAHVLTAKESIPLSELLLPFMKLSNNGIAEVLTKEMGVAVHSEGSWEKGIEVINDVIEDFEINRDTILFRDGSGMSHKTLIPSNELTQLLYKAQDKSWFQAFKRSLPIAGATEKLVGGTLRNRLTAEPVKNNVMAKTGSITGVSALSGYATASNGKELIFSILINNYLDSNETIQAIENEIVTILTEHDL